MLPSGLGGAWETASEPSQKAQICREFVPAPAPALLPPGLQGAAGRSLCSWAEADSEILDGLRGDGRPRGGLASAYTSQEPAVGGQWGF